MIKVVYGVEMEAVIILFLNCAFIKECLKCVLSTDGARL